MIEQTDTDGVPVLYAARPGPTRAGLLFRVGRADERAATAGITHLVEHLALHRHGLSDVHYNGVTGVAWTQFHVQGSADEAVDYLNGVSASLHDLPMDRMATELGILRTEAAGRGEAPGHWLAMWRYGAQGYGLPSYPEFGLDRLTPEEVRAWCAERFTAENAVLWLTGPKLPDGLRLDLPHGARQPLPAPTSALPRSPAFYAGGRGQVVVESVVRRSAAAQVYTGLLGRELFRQLRQEGGYSYSAAAEYERRDAEYATVAALADALPDQQDAVLGGVVDVLAQLRLGRLDEEAVAQVRARQAEPLDLPEVDALRLPAAAVDLLLADRKPREVEELRAQLAAVTPADVRAVAEEAHATTLLQTPAGSAGAEWAGFALAPQVSSEAVTGRQFASLEDPSACLVIGADGVSVVRDAEPVTVRYADCVLAWTRPDGAFELLGADGFRLSVEPTLFLGAGGDGVTALQQEVRAALDPALVIARPAREPGQIPRPKPKTEVPHSGATAEPRRPSWWWRVRRALGRRLGTRLLLVAVVVAVRLAFTLRH